MLDYADLIKGHARWARSCADVRAVLILGSRARSDHPADEWADLDLMVFAREVEQFTQTGEWVQEIAPAWLSFTCPTPDGKSWERRTVYEGGLDVDVALNPAEWLEQICHVLPVDVAEIVRRGVRILVDKDGQLARILRLPAPEQVAFVKPSLAEFANRVADFWFHALWSAKHLRRGELWWSKSGVDMYLKEHLRVMLEWHAKARSGGHSDTWLRGRFMEEWADERALAALPGVFGHYDARDTARALLATMELFAWLEREVASTWGYAFPQPGETKTAQAAEAVLTGL